MFTNQAYSFFNPHFLNEEGVSGEKFATLITYEKSEI
jgi:hypothetical protein